MDLSFHHLNGSTPNIGQNSHNDNNKNNDAGTKGKYLIYFLSATDNEAKVSIHPSDDDTD